MLYSSVTWLCHNLKSTRTHYMRAIKLMLGERGSTTNIVCLLEGGFPGLESLVLKRRVISNHIYNYVPKVCLYVISCLMTLYLVERHIHVTYIHYIFIPGRHRGICKMQCENDIKQTSSIWSYQECHWKIIGLTHNMVYSWINTMLLDYVANNQIW